MSDEEFNKLISALRGRRLTREQCQELLNQVAIQLYMAGRYTEH